MTDNALKKLWFTRCPVPTATGLAYKLGWLDEEFAADGITLSTLQEQPANSALARHHYDHDLPELIREGGNMLALAARAQGADTRLIGLTWIDEGQAIIVRAGSGVREASQLQGLRVALPAYVDHPIASHVRGCSIARGMSLHGVKGVLASAGLALEDVRFVEVEATLRRDGAGALQGLWAGLEHLAAGRVDAVYVKGAAAFDAARRLGLEVGVDIDALPQRFRVNNGTPRPITVHRSLLDNHPELVARFLAQGLRAADWAADNLDGVQRVLQDETRGSAQAVTQAYRDGFHRALHPDLSPERLALLRQQTDFLLLHGFLDADFDLEAWTDRRPLAAARRLLQQQEVAA
ncbi:ABC transporter substrate-binding protein [Pseudoduganella sp. FT26W]|uniref:ABC transporter substrate-binding protein n=1 Tax=Duganella aquatilis TaxID=2666082 RepID=A0A844DB16_9BURK|nr:ABC transporter substrate-binding protein [Duganella aquatilis]MRW87475.1 ABC transporter substrate-binding protein [Duganella aquatilis]